MIPSENDYTYDYKVVCVEYSLLELNEFLNNGWCVCDVTAQYVTGVDSVRGYVFYTIRRPKKY